MYSGTLSAIFPSFCRYAFSTYMYVFFSFIQRIKCNINEYLININIYLYIFVILVTVYDIVILNLCQGSVEHCMIGVQLLSQLTCEMNQISDADANRSPTKHRKIAISFRDTQLFEIFRLSCSLLGTARENCDTLNFGDESQVTSVRLLLTVDATIIIERCTKKR